MEIIPAEPTKPDPLLGWCQSVVAQHADQWPVPEQVLAESFVRSFGPGSISTFPSICQLCERLGIEVSVRPMPEDIRGHNHLYENKRVIVVSEHQTFPGANEHTVLHELREMMEHVLAKLGSRTCSSMEELEVRAEGFAASARSEAFGYTQLVYWKDAEQIEKKWVRYGVYALIGLGGLLYTLGLFFLPVLEDILAEERKRKRNVRT